MHRPWKNTPANAPHKRKTRLTGDHTTAFAGCMVARAMRQGSDALVAPLNQKGKARFGTGFGITTDMHYESLGDDKVVGDVDLVMPLMAL